MRTDPFSKNLPVPVLPGCCANTRGAAAMAVAVTPAFSILRLIGSIFGVLLTFGRLTTYGVDRPQGSRPYATVRPPCSDRMSLCARMLTRPPSWGTYGQGRTGGRRGRILARDPPDAAV